MRFLILHIKYFFVHKLNFLRENVKDSANNILINNFLENIYKRFCNKM